LQVIKYKRFNKMEKTSKNENTTKGEEKESFFEKLFKPRPNLEYELYKQKKTIGRTLNTNIGMYYCVLFFFFFFFFFFSFVINDNK